MQLFRALFQSLFPSKTSDNVMSRPEPDFRTIAENSSDIIIDVGPDKRASYVSPSCTRLLGWLPEELIGRGPEVFILPQYIAAIEEDMAALAGGKQDEGKLVMQVRAKDGRLLWVEARARVVRDLKTGQMNRLIVTMRDINDRKQFEDQMAALAMTDGLTGVLNRRAFDEALAREWEHTVRTSGQMSLLLLDIDHFKDFNDTYGHQAGDDCLRVVAAAIRSGLKRPADILARYGGEEFAVILPDVDASGAVEVAGRIRQAIADMKIPHLKSQTGRGKVTASVGVATALARNGGTIRMPEGLLLAADTALYKAKRNGRNRVDTALLLAPGGSTNVA